MTLTGLDKFTMEQKLDVTGFAKFANDYIDAQKGLSDDQTKELRRRGSRSPLA